MSADNLIITNSGSEKAMENEREFCSQLSRWCVHGKSVDAFQGNHFQSQASQNKPVISMLGKEK